MSGDFCTNKLWIGLSIAEVLKLFSLMSTAVSDLAFLSLGALIENEIDNIIVISYAF